MVTRVKIFNNRKEVFDKIDVEEFSAESAASVKSILIL